MQILGGWRNKHGCLLVGDVNIHVCLFLEANRDVSPLKNLTPMLASFLKLTIMITFEEVNLDVKLFLKINTDVSLLKKVTLMLAC